MSAANCPETPRQKMIGMMYLFLTAMLALNVSKSILDAFVVVNESLQATNETFESKNDIMYTQLEAAVANDPVKAKPFYEASVKVKKLAKDMRTFIIQLRGEVINETDGNISVEDGKTFPLHDIEAKDNFDAPTRFFCGLNDVVKNGKARELKEHLNKYRDDLLDILKDDKLMFNNKPKLIKSIGDLGIDTSDPEHVNPDHPEEKEWETANFYHLPLAAAVTMLSQMENQVQNAEATVISKLLGGIGSLDFKFDTLAAKVIPKSNYVIRGGQYEADLFVAAFSTTANPQVFVGEGYDSIKGELTGKVDSVPVVNGMGKYKVNASSEGIKKYAALIKIKNSNTGEVKSYPLKIDNSFTTSYTVAPPSATVSPTKMNMLYIGVENPIDISASGFGSDRISAHISGSGSKIYRKGGQWVVKVKKPTRKGKPIKISISVKDDDGNTVNMGSFPFRVAYIPKAEAVVAGKTGGMIKKSVLKVQGGIKAYLKDFAFDLSYRVVSYNISIAGGTAIPVKSYKFTPKVKAQINKAKRGSMVVISNIMVVGPDKIKKPAANNAIVFKIN